MNIAQIEENVKQLLSYVSTGGIANNDFIFEFMLAYDHRKSSVSRVKSGERNL